MYVAGRPYIESDVSGRRREAVAWHSLSTPLPGSSGANAKKKKKQKKKQGTAVPLTESVQGSHQTLFLSRSTDLWASQPIFAALKGDGVVS